MVFCASEGSAMALNAPLSEKKSDVKHNTGAKMTPDRAHNASQHTSVSASIVLFHSDIDLFIATLEALATATYQLKHKLQLFILDQSLDNVYTQRAQKACAETLFAANITLNYQTSTTNKGYGAGHNQIPSSYVGDVHIVLNPDIELDPLAIANAMDLFDGHPELAVISPCGRLIDGSVDRLAKRHPSLLVLLLRAFAPQSAQRLFTRQLSRYEYRDLCMAQFIAPIELASGCCMMIRRSVWQQLRGFDESYFLYFEDYDLSKRAAQYGVVAQCSQVKVLHHGGNAARKGMRHIFLFGQGLIRFFNRWGWKFI